MREDSTIILDNVTITYPNGTQGIKDISFALPKNSVTSLIGAAGSGRTTLLRSFNLMHELYSDIKKEGKIGWNGKNLLEMNPLDVRRKVGMIFDNPVSFPHISIFKNVIFGYTLNNIRLSKRDKEDIVKTCLTEVGLWEEVQDILDKKPEVLNPGQQQRLSIARTIAMNPEIILMDNPTALLSDQDVSLIEELIVKLKKNHTILLVPQSINQAARISDYVAFLEKGELIEFDTTNNMLVNPCDARTELFITQNNE